MKNIVYLSLICLAFTACKKENKKETEPDNKTYTVKLNVSTAQQGPLTTTAVSEHATPSPLGDFANRLQYWVYNSSGQLITQLVQDKTSANFGQIDDTFLAGTYTIVLLAQNVTTISPGLPVPPTTYAGGLIQLFGKDSFFKTFSLTVGTTNVSQNVTLDRINGQLQVKITDALIASVANIKVEITSETKNSIATGLPDPSKYALTLNYPVKDSVGRTNVTLTSYISNTTSPFKVVITAFDASGKAVGTGSADNVTCALNTRTILSGKLFETFGDYNFNVTFDQTWDTPVLVPFIKNPYTTLQVKNKQN